MKKIVYCIYNKDLKSLLWCFLVLGNFIAIGVCRLSSYIISLIVKDNFAAYLYVQGVVFALAVLYNLFVSVVLIKKINTYIDGSKKMFCLFALSLYVFFSLLTPYFYSHSSPFGYFLMKALSWAL